MFLFLKLRVLQPFFRVHWLTYSIGVLLLISVDLLQLLIPRIIGKTVDFLISSREEVFGQLLLLVFISILIAVLRYIYRECIMGTTRRLEYYLRKRIFSHALRLPMSFFDEHGPGKIMALTTNDVSAVRVAIGLGIMLFVDAVIMGAASLIVMVKTINWQLAAWTILPLPIIFMLVIYMGKFVHDRFRKVQENFSSMTEFTQEVFAGVKIIKGFAAERTTLERFSSINKANVAANMEMAQLQAAYIPVTHIAPLTCYAIALFVGGDLIIKGAITIGEFAAFSGYLGLIIWPVMGLGYLINTVQRGAASLNRISDLLDQPAYEDRDEPVETSKEIRETDIRITNLTFQYPTGKQPALTNLSLFIPAGTVLGIVGHTGAGKSTLLQLLLRLYNPPENTIFISNREIHAIDYNSLRQAVGYVPQDSLLFSKTIAENIAFDQPYLREQIEQAAQLAVIQEAIDDKPLGFGTILGEKGKKLSGGQQQRVAIARALIKEPAILLLDDIFAALDYRTQAELLANMSQFTAGRTTLIVSQRVAAVKSADLIIVMKEGSIAEQGTHQQLIEKKGLYYELYEQQLMNGEE
ncbi:ABC transporter ATP-binding protein [Anaerospora sp.]|uniref:ABC transporter ATP-binding protein n=1 Tax=Anaerospora sp. TaxID=1960278 RepID=UPI0028A0A7AC|nr:ABC transporter ATP-binding protein [Anaerospora sp.]MDF2928358.1 transporter related protein [Anaerospora sp.]